MPVQQKDSAPANLLDDIFSIGGGSQQTQASSSNPIDLLMGGGPPSSGMEGGVLDLLG
jgi:hypothetical protein